MTAVRARDAGEAGKDLSRAATSGFVWLLVQSFAARGIGFFSQLILARLLLPADFGAIGLAYTVTGVANSLVSFGVDDVLLQRQKSIRWWSTPAFWLCLGLGTLGMVVMIAAAPFAARWYHAPELVGLIAAIAVATPLRTLATVPAVRIRAEMDFRFLATFNTFDIFALQVLTIVFAACGLGAYSFAIPFPILAAVRAVWFWRRSPPEIRNRARVVQLRYLMSNSSVVFLTKTLIEIVNQGDYIVLGLIASQSIVGFYFFAFRFSVQPVRMLAGNFTNVLFPALAQLRYDPARQTQAAVKACRLLAFLVMPFCFLQAALARPGLHLLFGERWMDAVPYVQILSIGLPFDAISWITGALLSARREFRRAFVYALVSTPAFFGLVLLGAWLGQAMGVAIAVGVYYFVYPPATSFLVLCKSGVSWRAVVDFYLSPSALAAVAVGLGQLGAASSAFAGHDFAQCMVIGVACCVAYPALVFVFKRDMFEQIAQRFRNMSGKLGRKLSAA